MSPPAGTPAVVVLASLAAPLDAGLDELLGPEGADALRAALAARARRWAAAISPDVAFEATTAGAASVALHDHDGPVLLASWDVPGLDLDLARLALEDLAHGAFVSVAPAMDGRPFLVGLPRADHDLFELLESARHDDLFARAAAHEEGMGMLRSERRLVSAGDVRALAADPLAPPDLLAALGDAVPVRARYDGLLRAHYAERGGEPAGFRLLPDGRVAVAVVVDGGAAEEHHVTVRDGRVVTVDVVGPSSS